MRKLLSLFALWRDPDWRKLFIVCAVIVLIAAAGVQMDRINPFAVYNIWNVTREPGATADLQIQSCLTNRIPNGGICDARGYGATNQSVASNTVINAKQKVLFDSATMLQPANSTVNMFTVEPEGAIEGATLDCSTQPNYSGIAFQNDSTKQYTLDASGTAALTRFAHLHSTHACQSVPTGVFLKLAATTFTAAVYELDVEDIVASGLHDGLLLQASNGGFVNGLRIINYLGHQNIVCIHNNHPTTSGHVDSNTIIGSCEAGGTGTNVAQDGWLFDGLTGTSTSAGNRFIGDLWDYSEVIGGGVPPFAATTTVDTINMVMGEIDGTATDVVGNNCLWNTRTGNIKCEGNLADFGSYRSPITLNTAGQVNLSPDGLNYVGTDNSALYFHAHGGPWYFNNNTDYVAQITTGGDIRFDSNTALANYGALTGTFTAARTFTFPDVGGKVPVFAVTTVGSLPTCNGTTQDQMRVVTDASAPTYNATIVGGGAVRIAVYCNGSNWTAH